MAIMALVSANWRGTMDIDAMTQAFVEFKESSPNIDDDDWSELDTRSKFIDTVLIDCLGWQEGDIRREKSKDGTRLDYLLSTTRPILVVEAKRSSKAFAISGRIKPYSIEIRNLLKVNPALKEAFSQVISYCIKWSVPTAALTNGRSYIIFLAVRTDGIPMEEGKAVVISDIFAEGFNFAHLTHYLMRSVVAEGQLVSELIGTPLPKTLKSVISTYADQDSIKGANAIGLALQPLLEQVFTDVTKDDSPEVLEHCYVPPGSSVLRNEDFEALLLDKPPSFTAVANVISVTSQNAYHQFQDNIKAHLARRRQGQTLLVVGRIGVGKTMFLVRYFTYPYDNGDPIKNATVPLFVDFRKAGLDPVNIPNLIYSRLRKLIEELNDQQVPGEKQGIKYDFLSSKGLTQVFWPEISKLKKGFDPHLLKEDSLALRKENQRLVDRLKESDEAFVNGAIRVLRERYHRYVCVILDNADQCSPDYQRAVYLFARTLEDTLQCLVIVALREEWYWYFGFKEKDGPFSAYHDTIYYIPAPRSRDVLAKRLEYSIDLTESRKVPSVDIELPGNLIINASHLERYLRVCHQAFFNDDEITIFFECLSNGIVRKGLKAFLEFLRSGHTHVNEYLKAFVAKETYVLLFHHVFKSIACGQYRHYASKRSLIPNVFQPVHDANRNYIGYFTRLYLLYWLDQQKNRQTPAGDGFVAIPEVNSFLLQLGAPFTVQKDLLKLSVKTDLIEPDIRIESDYDDWHYLRITAFGLYMLKSLCGRFCYIETVMLETPLLDDKIRDCLARVYGEGTKPSLDARLASVLDFVKHLHALELSEQIRVVSAGLGPTCPSQMRSIRIRIENEIDAIKARVARRKSPPKIQILPIDSPSAEKIRDVGAVEKVD